MTRREAKRLGNQCEHWKALLGMAGWNTELHVHESFELPADLEGGIGRLEPDAAMACADIHVAEHAHNTCPTDTLVHELVHLVLTDMRCANRRACEQLDNVAGDVLREVYIDAEERATVRLTRALLKLWRKDEADA